jgi:hypothetical protein
MRATPSQFATLRRSPRKGNAKHCDEHNAQLVDGRHTSCIAELEGAEVADPGAACCEAREHQKQVAAARIDDSGCHCPVPIRIAPNAARMTMVRMKVGIDLRNPDLGDTAVRAAKEADRMAQNCQYPSRAFIAAHL